VGRAQNGGSVHRQPWRISARSNQSRSRGGASSGSTRLLAVVRFFVGMPVPHRDDAPRVVARRPNHHDETTRSQPAVMRFVRRGSSWFDPARFRQSPGRVRRGSPALGFVPAVPRLAPRCLKILLSDMILPKSNSSARGGHHAANRRTSTREYSEGRAATAVLWHFRSPRSTPKDSIAITVCHHSPVFHLLFTGESYPNRTFRLRAPNAPRPNSSPSRSRRPAAPRGRRAARAPPPSPP
jgi:hypothetical protein